MSFKWDDQSKAKLRELWDAGLSASKIGQEIGVSKNSIIGASHRMKLKPRASPIAYAARSIPRPVMVSKEQEKPVQAVKIAAPVVEPRPKKVLHTPGNALLRTCRFPNGDPSKSSFRFCGKPTVLGKPYCAACCDIAYIKPSRAA